MLLSATDLTLLVGGFSVTHIGLSAVREPLIAACGSTAARLNLVGSGVELPKIWLADTTGYEIWPDEAIAGRQIYRAGYTAVASALLFPALAAYPEARASESLLVGAQLGPATWTALFAVAAGAQGISIASLFNPSPLSLVPGFAASNEAPLGIQRDDRLKLEPLGLTRITRHPLILPVVPWGVANCLLGGGQLILGRAEPHLHLICARLSRIPSSTLGDVHHSCCAERLFQCREVRRGVPVEGRRHESELSAQVRSSTVGKKSWVPTRRRASPADCQYARARA